MEKKIAIVGAGVGGLSAGCYAQMNGFQTDVFEMHSLPGGQCTSWRRKGFTIDGCIHHLAGCAPDSRLYGLWRELGAMPARPIILPRDMCQVQDETGRTFTVLVDPDRLQQQMLEISPHDRATINHYITGIRSFLDMDLLDTPLLGRMAYAKRFVTFMGVLMKWRMPMSRYAMRFKDPFLRKAFPTIQYDWTDTPLFVHLNMMGNCASGNYGVPAGGSLEFSEAIARQYESLGGRLHYKNRVEEVLTKNGQAVGVRTADGTEHQADIVLSDAFAYTTIFHLLKGRYVNDAIQKQFSRPEDVIVMGLHVSFGVSMDLSREPRALVLFLKKPMQVADRVHERLDIELFGYDPSLASPGKSVLKVLLNTSYAYWKELSKTPDKYRAAKEAAARTVLEGLKQRFPDIMQHVEMVDVATPVTTERYIGVSHGYTMSLGLDFIRARPKTLPGLRGFYMVGGSAGLPGCAAMGRNAIQELCSREHIEFTHEAG
jgi:phytoene dehydrogenase-like protein